MTHHHVTPDSSLPVFSAIRPAGIEAGLRQLIDESRSTLYALLDSGAASWESLVVPLEEMHHHLGRYWSPIGHLNAVLNNDELRAAYNACLPVLTAWYTDLGQNERLYRAYQAVLEKQGGHLTAGQRILLERALRDFRLAGVALPEAQKQRFKELAERLSSVCSRFDENVLDSTNAWSRNVTDETELTGLPAAIIERARAAAEAKGEPGWLFSLDAPNYMAVMTHASSEALRREFYTGWVTRSSDQGQPRWDNSSLMEEIVALRHERARLVGFDSYAEYSLATKMADSVQQVEDFLGQMADLSRPAARRELDELTRFAGRDLNAWDVAFHAEKLKEQRFALSEEALRPYFPLPRVLAGLFTMVSMLYGVRIVERHDVDLYHPDVRFFDILEQDGSRRASFYIDLYARSRKRGGAWMDECIGRTRLTSCNTQPVAYLVCNFMPPSGDKPSLLTHSEVVTLFHEFGHGLHHMLTRIDYPSIAGINGVAWDAVELPSQFMENFAWASEVLPLISGHVDTGEPLPVAELERLQASRTFQAGMQTVRQIEFALFDLRIHGGRPLTRAEIETTLAGVRAEVAVIKPPAFNRFAHSFQHIFSGGYAAGYYSYKWAEVLAADAFSAFEEHGLFDAGIAQRFLTAILEKGGSQDAMDAFIEFRGRKPEIKPLLRQLGLAA
jgi:oligopeptidase A